MRPNPSLHRAWPACRFSELTIFFVSFAPLSPKQIKKVNPRYERCAAVMNTLR
jgi:hypothetical protein